MSIPLIKCNTSSRLSDILPGVAYESSYQKVGLCIHRYTKPQSIGEGVRWVAYRIVNILKRIFTGNSDWTVARKALMERYEKLEGPGLEAFKEQSEPANWVGNWTYKAAENHLELLTLLNKYQLHEEATKRLNDWIDDIRWIEKYNIPS